MPLKINKFNCMKINRDKIKSVFKPEGFKILVLSLFTNVALAAPSSNLTIVENMVERTNDSISRDVERVQALAEATISNLGNNFISRGVVDVMIFALVTLTNAKAQATIRAARALGVTVECEYVRYYIGYRWVWIDPLYVISD